jgi:predicted acylesterase/phospholipase RssA
MLKALVERGVRPDFVVGASLGAINAAYYAGSPDSDGWIGSSSVLSVWKKLSATALSRQLAGRLVLATRPWRSSRSWFLHGASFLGRHFPQESVGPKIG